ncbi:hypothetical protein JW935_15410 [candidate division KSB1 bacterium]|nr:hypothetical protein [candidate division KSB1 bacterium]
MKIFKSIFRFDYPLAYKILDKLGEYLENINNTTKEGPFSDGSGKVDLIQHALSFNAKVNEDVFTLNLNLNTFNAVIEFQNGTEVKTLCKHPLFQFSENIIKKIRRRP